MSWAGTLGKEVPSAPRPASPGGHKKEVVGLGGRWVPLPRWSPSPVGRLGIVTSIFSSFLSNLSTGEKPHHGAGLLTLRALRNSSKIPGGKEKNNAGHPKSS